jgi:NAD(P)-dependent dehydrogenase (short-subunit alcohol dehydrogenase family)
MPSNIIDMSGKVVLITGGSRGLGRAMALGFAEAGADVCVASRKIDGCNAVVKEIDALGRKGFAVAANVSHWDQCDALVDAVYEHFGRVDVLINNAGLSPLYDKLSDVTEALWDKVIAINLRGPFRLSSLIGERMVAGVGLDDGEEPAGAIINISSTGAIRARGDIIPYAAAKAGLNAMTEGFAQAFGPKVRVNCIMPGPFLTDISKAWDMDVFNERAERTIALKRGGLEHEIVGAALYLGSSQSSYTTGAILRVDGGTE